MYKKEIYYLIWNGYVVKLFKQCYLNSTCCGNQNGHNLQLRVVPIASNYLEVLYISHNRHKHGICFIRNVNY